MGQKYKKSFIRWNFNKIFPFSFILLLIIREEKEVRVKEVLFYDFLGEVCFIAAIIFLILFKN